MAVVGEGKGLVLPNDASRRMFGDGVSEAGLPQKAGLCELGSIGKSVSSLPPAPASHIPSSSKLVYVKYKDHVFFKNIQAPVAEAVVREAVGWVREQNDELLLLESDRAVLKQGKSVNGVVILKNCIICMMELPLKNNPKRSLNCSNINKKASMRFSQRGEKLKVKER